MPKCDWLDVPFPLRARRRLNDEVPLGCIRSPNHMHLFPPPPQAAVVLRPTASPRVLASTRLTVPSGPDNPLTSGLCQNTTCSDHNNNALRPLQTRRRSSRLLPPTTALPTRALLGTLLHVHGSGPLDERPRAHWKHSSAKSTTFARLVGEQHPPSTTSVHAAATVE